MINEEAEWVRLNVLPAMWHLDDGIEELRTCVCQAPASDWLGGIEEPAARLWNRNGLPVAWAHDGSHGRFVAGLVFIWETGRVCRRRYP